MLDQGSAAKTADWAERLERVLADVDATDDFTREVRAYVLEGSALNGSARDAAALRAVLSPGGAWMIGDTSTVDRQALLYADPTATCPDVMARWATLLDLVCHQGGNPSLPIGPVSRVDALIHHMDRTLTVHAQVQWARAVAFDWLESVVRSAGGDPADLVAHVLLALPSYRRGPDPLLRQSVTAMPGWSAALARYGDGLHERVSGATVDGRLAALRLLAPLSDIELRSWSPVVVSAATSSTRALRTHAEPLVRRLGAAAWPALMEVATTGDPRARLAAFDLMWTSAASPERRDELFALASADRSPTIRRRVATWSSRPTSGQPETVAVPERTSRPVDWSVECTPEVTAMIATMARAFVERHEVYDGHARSGRHNDATTGRTRPWAGLDPAHVVERVTALLASPAAPTPGDSPLGCSRWPCFLPAIEEAAASPAMSLVSLVKVLHAESCLVDHDGRSLHFAAFRALHRFVSHHDGVSLLDLEELLRALGIDGARTIWASYVSRFQSFAADWPPEAIWPFVDRNLDLLLSMRIEASSSPFDDGLRFYGALRTYPELPGRVVDVLVDLAVGGRQADRDEARALLAGRDDALGRAVERLADAQAETRARAADWLGQLGDPTAVADLEQALRKERAESTKAALLDALQALGQPMSRYVSRQDLVAQARKGLAKGLPPDLEWLDWSALPPVRWHDGDPVDDETIRWVVVAAVKARSPEPGALLRRYAQLLDPADRAELAAALLESWISNDLTPFSREEADAAARAAAAERTNDPSEAAVLAARYVPHFRRQPRSSGIASKGVLAVVGAFADGRSVDPVRRYLRDWYGIRAGQSKALLAALSWVDDPAAVQFVLGVGTRFRTKGIQAEAIRLSGALAERRGWSVADVADRTVPTAGFDAGGRLRLEHGGRTFVAVLRPDLTLVLVDEAGSQISSFPAARAATDEDSARAKQQLARARKELREVRVHQTRRLHEAMCAGRSWPADDWQHYFVDHPLMVRLCERLHWTVERDGIRSGLRLLPGGRLVDSSGSTVRLRDGDRLLVAHRSHLPEDDVRRLIEQGVGSGAEPLFEQLGREWLGITEAERYADGVDDRCGWMVRALRLRGVAKALGYERGPTEDGGWFHTYVKTFPTIGLTAIVEFTGNRLPETERPSALVRLDFRRADPGAPRVPVPLDEVPPILLSETRHELHAMASAGTGFDPHWTEKTGHHVT